GRRNWRITSAKCGKSRWGAPPGLHPMRETAKRRIKLPAVCAGIASSIRISGWNGAQKFVDASPDAVALRSPIEKRGAETAITAQTSTAVHPMGETAKIRTEVKAVSCRQCLQGSNYCRYGAQKFVSASPLIETGGAGIAEIAEIPVRSGAPSRRG